MSKPTTVAQYLAGVPEDRRAALESLRKVILKNLDRDYEEGIQYGMIGYFVPHRVFPPGYHCDPKQPLPFVGMASQKNYMSLYMMCVYGAPERERAFQDAWAKTGKKLDMGKACVRFKKLEDLALDVIGATIKSVPAKTYIAHYQALLDTRVKGRPAGNSAKSAAKKATGKASAKAAAKPAKTSAVKPGAKKSPAKRAAPKPTAKKPGR